MSEHLVQRSQSNAENQNKEIHGSITMDIDRSILYVSHAKWIVGLYFIIYIFLNYCFIWKYLTNNNFLLICRLWFLDTV